MWCTCRKKKFRRQKTDLTLANKRCKNRKISRIRVYTWWNNIIPKHGTEGLRTKIRNYYSGIEIVYTNNNYYYYRTAILKIKITLIMINFGTFYFLFKSVLPTWPNQECNILQSIVMLATAVSLLTPGPSHVLSTVECFQYNASFWFIVQ